MLGIVLSLVLVMTLVFFRVHIIIAAPLAAFCMALFSGLPLMPTLTQNYMAGLAGFAQMYLPLFVLSAIFGKVMEVSGAASAVAHLLGRFFGAKYAIYAIVFGGIILCYGGVTVFVIVFALYPIALALFKEADLPRHLIPAAIAAGAFLSPNLLPGSPQVVNIIPTTYLGTTPMAAPAISLIISVFLTALAVLYIAWQCRVARAKGEHFVADDHVQQYLGNATPADTPNPWVALIPMAVVIISMNVLKMNVLVAIIIGIVVCTAIFWNRMSDKLDAYASGINGAVLAIINTAAAVGLGAVAKLTSGFQVLVDWVSTFDGPPLVSLGLATSLVAGATGSGSGGLGIALDVLSTKYLAMGVHPEILHRVATIAAIGLDSLPHNGVMITLLTVCGLTHREGYRHLFWITVICTTVTLVLTIILGTLMYPVVPPVPAP